MRAFPASRALLEFQPYRGVSLMRQHFQIPIVKPAEIIPRLGKQELHWKVGRSAYELSTAWMESGSIPPKVKSVLDQASEWAGASLLEGIFERETDLPGGGRPSQTDLLAILSTDEGNSILAVEGKVDESFGPVVGKWLATENNQNRANRLAGLCATLDIDPDVTGGLFYQLFHRTCAAVYEAKRFKYKQSMMLVHSFAGDAGSVDGPAWFSDFCNFSQAVGMPVYCPDTVSSAKTCDGIEVRLAWVCDMPKSLMLS